jgi:hypothetical protein
MSEKEARILALAVRNVRAMSAALAGRKVHVCPTPREVCGECVRQRTKKEERSDSTCLGG